MLALEGKQLGNYDVIRRLRVGGMGAVYEGRQRTAFGRRVAIKVILGSYADDPDMRRRFAREARTVARLQHPHILPLIEFGEEQGLLYLVMPFIDGGTLTSFLHHSLPDLSEVSAMYVQLLDAIEYAHDEGLIHRDIKSSNVLLEPRRSGPPHVYLADFGLVRSSQAQADQVGKPIPLDQVPGTSYYMAPEQTRGIVTTSSDIYALGVLLYQVLTGELPYDDPDEVKVIQMHLSAPVPSPCERDASIPPELGEIVRTAMAKHAEDRFASVTELRDAFLAAVEGAGVDRQNVPIYEDLSPLLVDEPMSLPGRPIALPLTSQDAPLVVPLKRRASPLHAAAPAPLRVRQQAARPQPRGRKRFTPSFVVAMAVPTILLVLLLMPRVLGISFFPSGFPVFGTTPVATVTVTPASKTLQNTFLLTASTQVKGPDLTTRVLPAHSLNATATNSRVTQTSGTKLIHGAQARGSVFFQNGGITTISVPAGIIFTTGSGVQIRLSQAVDVPPAQVGQAGTASAPAVAVSPGESGNIAADALKTTCCNGQVLVSNPRPFEGGIDARLAHFVAQADLDGMRNALAPALQQRATQQLEKELQKNEVMAAAPAFTTSVSSNYPVGAQVDQVLVQVSITATATAYNRYTATHMAAQLLSNEATQMLGSNFQPQGMPAVETPRVVQQDGNGLIYLSVAAHGLWLYSFSTQQVVEWRQAIKNALPKLALAYLDEQPGVAAVRVQLPFGTDHLPSSPDQIKIVLAE